MMRPLYNLLFSNLLYPKREPVFFCYLVDYSLSCLQAIKDQHAHLLQKTNQSCCYLRFCAYSATIT